MFTGMMIDELVEMVARAENHAHDGQPAADLDRSDKMMASQFMYGAAEPQPMMIGVA